jgi:UDP-glucuronate decarboxylase
MTDRKRIIVTGGAGFVGSHLCDRLIGMGHEVVAVDDLTTGSERNLAAHAKEPRLRFVRHDVAEPYDIEADWLFNLACPASPVHYQRDPVKTLVTNVQGTLNGLRLAKTRGMRFLQASTSEVYGDPDVHPQHEGYRGNVNPIGPRACYDEGKRCAETLAFDFHRQLGVDIRVVRIFNTYGPRMAFDDGRVVSNFLVQAIRGDDLTVFGDGSQTRSFCFVDDLVTGLVSMMEHPSDIGPVNLGNPTEFTMIELAEAVLALVPTKSKIVFRPLPVDDPRQRRPDIGRARQLFAFHPKTDVREGLERTLAEFRQRIGEQSTHA